MKVLHVAPFLALENGGVSVSVRELCLGLAESGVEVDLWSMQKREESRSHDVLDQPLRRAGVRVRYFPARGIGPFWNWFGYNPDLDKALSESVPCVGLIHIHGLWLYPALAATRAGRRFQVPYVVSPCGALDAYSLQVRKIRKMLYGFFIERRNLGGAAAIHFTSTHEKESSWTFGLRRPAAVIPRSLDPRRLPKLRPGLFRSLHPEIKNRKILLFLGRLHPKKRLDFAVETFVQVCGRREDVHLVVTGPDEGSASHALRRLKEANLLDRASFSGPLMGDAKWAAFSDASIFLLPSLDENFGMAALEAMAAGIPVLLSAHVAIGETAARHGAGLVPEENPSAWAQAAVSILERPEWAAQMGSAGRRLVEERFSTPATALRMKQLYQAILKNPASPDLHDF